MSSCGVSNDLMSVIVIILVELENSRDKRCPLYIHIWISIFPLSAPMIPLETLKSAVHHCALERTIPLCSTSLIRPIYNVLIMYTLGAKSFSPVAGLTQSYPFRTAGSSTFSTTL